MLADHIGVPQLRSLASRSEQIVDEVSVRDMSRVAELLHSAHDNGPGSSNGKLKLIISFLHGVEGFPEISFKVSGQLGISCQRCLGLLQMPVDLRFHLVVVESEADLDNIAEPFDAIVAGEHGIRLTSLIEDELLASLPLAPMHEDAGNCDIEIRLLRTDSNTGPEKEISRPFADLATLMAKNRKQNPTDKTN